MEEQILYIDRKELEGLVDIYLEKIPYSEEDLKNTLNQFKPKFVSRSLAEKDVSKKQIISYCIVVNEKDQVLTYSRKGNEKRLHGLLSIGIGGHINNEDEGNDFYDSVYKGTVRELEEELPGIANYQLTPLGLINEEKTSVGHVHTGFACLVKIKNDNSIQYSEELSNHKWLSLEDISLEHFEHWSQLALELLLKKPKKLCMLFSHTLTEVQKKDAKKYLGINEFLYLPKNLQEVWSNIRPTGSLDTDSLLEIISWLSSQCAKGDYVLIQGDFGAVVYTVSAVENLGLIPIYATTQRQTTEVQVNDSVTKTQVFKHETFRRYRL